MSDVPAVEVSDLAVRFNQRQRVICAVNGVSFRLARGEVLGILGESGSGKSVTLRALMRLLPTNCAIDGRIAIDGEDITAAPENRLEELRHPHPEPRRANHWPTPPSLRTRLRRVSAIPTATRSRARA